MNITLRHQLTQDGDVLITSGGAQPKAIHVPAHEARRFAWAILADLDPEEASRAGNPLEAPLVHARGTQGEYPRAAWGSQIERIIEALSSGAKDTRRIAAMVECSTQQAAVQLSKLKSGGVVMMTSRSHGPGNPATWALGSVPLSEWRARRGGGARS